MDIHWEHQQMGWFSRTKWGEVFLISQEGRILGSACFPYKLFCTPQAVPVPPAGWFLITQHSALIPLPCDLVCGAPVLIRLQRHPACDRCWGWWQSFSPPVQGVTTALAVTFWQQLVFWGPQSVILLLDTAVSCILSLKDACLASPGAGMMSTSCCSAP